MNNGTPTNVNGSKAAEVLGAVPDSVLAVEGGAGGIGSWNRRLGSLAAGLAHEVRNPLNSALLQLTVLQRRLDRGDCPPTAVCSIAQVVEGELLRLERLVNDFIAFAQPRPLNRRPTDVASLCQSIAAIVRPESEAASLSLELDLDSDLPPLAADPERLQHVLLHLLHNAIDAMSPGGTVTLRARRRPEAIELEVADTGPGLPDGPVFDAFFTTKPQGTGLGLSVVHRAVTDHGGTVSVNSHPGDTRFVVSLPLEGAKT
jgi:signal transduction histidine kinase